MRGRFGSRRGSAMVEGALVFLVFAVLMAGVLELGVVGFAANSVSFAAHRAARFASLRGSTSGRAATVDDIRASARTAAAPLNTANLTVNVSWTPSNSPGGSVQVTVAYALRPALLPLSLTPLTLQSIARARILQ
jgi:Flp pilus assembly protein TadG